LPAETTHGDSRRGRIMNGIGKFGEDIEG